MTLPKVYLHSFKLPDDSRPRYLASLLPQHPWGKPGKDFDPTAEIQSLEFDFSEHERLRKLDVEYGKVEAEIVMADPEFDADSDHASQSDRLIASIKRLRAKGDG